MQSVRLASAIRLFRPLDQGRAVHERFVEPQLVHVGFAHDAIEVEMRHGEVRQFIDAGRG